MNNKKGQARWPAHFCEHSLKCPDYYRLILAELTQRFRKVSSKKQTFLKGGSNQLYVLREDLFSDSLKPVIFCG